MTKESEININETILSPTEILLTALKLEEVIINQEDLDIKLSHLRNLKTFLQLHISDSFSINLHLCYLRNFPTLDTFNYSLAKILQHYCMNEVIDMFINFLQNINNQQEKVEAMRYISKCLFYPFFEMNHIYAEYCTFEETLSKITADTLISEIENEFSNVIKMRNKLILNSNIINNNSLKEIINIKEIKQSDFNNKILKNVKFEVFKDNLELEKTNPLKFNETQLYTRIYKLFLFELESFWDVPEFYYLWSSFDIKEGDIMQFDSKFIKLTPIEIYHYYNQQYLIPELFSYPLYSQTLLYLNPNIQVIKNLLKKIYKYEVISNKKIFYEKVSLLQINYLTRILIESNLQTFRKEYNKILNKLNYTPDNDFLIFFITFCEFIYNRNIDYIIEIYENLEGKNRNVSFLMIFNFLKLIDLEKANIFEKIFSSSLINRSLSYNIPIREITDEVYNLTHMKGDQRFKITFNKLTEKLNYGELKCQENNINSFLYLFYNKFNEKEIKDIKAISSLMKNVSISDYIELLKRC